MSISGVSSSASLAAAQLQQQGPAAGTSDTTTTRSATPTDATSVGRQRHRTDVVSPAPTAATNHLAAGNLGNQGGVNEVV